MHIGGSRFAESPASSSRAWKEAQGALPGLKEVRRLSREACGLLRKLRRDTEFLEELFRVLTVRDA